MIVCALDMTWIIPDRDQSQSFCSKGRKHGESEDIWGVTELELDEIRVHIAIRIDFSFCAITSFQELLPFVLLI